jgi:GntR family transcriptional regulator
MGLVCTAQIVIWAAMGPSAAPPKPAPATGRKSAYRQLADELREMIRGGITEGQRLPTELELIGQYQLSRQTVRRAYLELVAEGAVERIPGRGTYPARRGHYMRSFGSIEELLALSLDTELQVIEPLSVKTDADEALTLGLQFDDVLHIGYRRLHQNLAFCYTDVYLPPRMDQYVREATFLKSKGSRSRATILGLLDQVLPHPVVGAKQVVTALAAPREVASQIDCLEGEPILKIERLHFDADGRPVEHCVNHFNPERYSYRLQLQRRPGSHKA